MAAAAAITVLASCNGGASPPLPNPQAFTALRSLHRHASSPIQHVVVIVQENRSFNNLFYGYPGARTSKYGYDSKGNKIELQPIDLDTAWDVDHNSAAFFDGCNGAGSVPGTMCRMNGFDTETWTCGHSGQPPCPFQDPPYSYVKRSEVEPYFEMAKQYVLADEMFSSNFDGSFVSHQYLIAGQSNSAVDYPQTLWGCPGGPSDTVETINSARQIGNPIPACWDVRTLGDELDDAGLSWAYYASSLKDDDGAIWSAYQAIEHIYNGPDWSNDVISPQTQFFADVSGGNLRTVSWITPTCENSDHAGCDKTTGPSWVASLVNAIGQSNYWDSTAIFILWDDWGGWYDPVAPKTLDYDGLGIRVPLLIVSAYAKAHHVSHVHLEHGSILRFIEDQFGLGRLAASDRRATSPQHDAFDFGKPPRAFVTIPSDYGIPYFKHQPLDKRLPDSE
jgi:phospholipase C